VLVSDVTVLKQAEVELKLAASVFENTIEGIFVTDGNGVILSVNPAFTSITGFTADEAIGRTPRILRSDRHDEAFYAAVWRDIAAKGQWQGQIWNRRKDGETFLEWQTITKIPAPEGEPVRYISVFNDITELWRKDEYIRHLAFHDALTDLPNRALLMERLNHQTAIAKREQRLLAVMFLDLDRFKFVNDSFGHDVGDDLLKAVAQKLLALVRQSDTVARLGGDEFVIVLNNPESQAEVTHIADRVVTVINEPMEFCGKTAQVGTSIGIAMYPTNGDTPAELIKSADTAMYAAKAAGKNTHRFFNVDMVAGY
jgi:diguanylate cyclase (GGDEF)-like protein/PAS domain S-box-containing protein